LVLRARERGIPVRTVHNASIMNAIGACGLQLYTFGQTVSIVFFTETWRPDSFYDKIAANRKLGLHTLCLLGACGPPTAGRTGWPECSRSACRSERVETLQTSR